jgi:hypothetical protein
MEYSLFKIFSQNDEKFIQKKITKPHCDHLQMELAKFGYRSDRN